MDIVTLDKAQCGHKFIIEDIVDKEPNKLRLYDMGFTKGSIITPLFSSPFSDPTAYEIKGAIIAIRKKQARNINVLTSRCDNYERQQ